MTTSQDSDTDLRNPHARPLGGAGLGAIIVPLIIGGAIIVAGIVLWEAHVRKQAVSEISLTEIKVRGELRAAYADLRARRPEEALEHAGAAGQMMERQLKSRWRTEYLELRTARNLIEADAFMMQGPGAHKAAEELLDQALGWMTQTGGEYWLHAMLGRARARFEAGRNQEAAADLDMLLDRNPSFGAAYYWRALARRALGDARGGAADEERARNLGAWPPVMLQMGNLQ